MPSRPSAQSFIPIIRTKITIPGIRPHSIDRKTLIAKLAAGIAQGLPLSLISAPPGYGKTTIAVELLRSRQDSVSWFSIDAADNDPFRFFTYLLNALRDGAPNFGNLLNRIINQGQLPPWETLISYFINELVNLPQQRVLVLEDYHRITDPQLHGAIQFLLEQNLPLLHVIIITREDPPFPLTIWRARNRLTEIRAADLRFTPQETFRFFAETMGVRLTAEQVAMLEARTEGWITGLQLVGLSVNALHPDAVPAFLESCRGNSRFILEYLTETVLHNLAPELRAFMGQIAVLERFSASICDTVTGRTDSRKLLKQLERANLFLIVLDPQGEWYRFHHLFADLLRLEVPPQCQSAIRRKAAAWFEADRQTDAAVSLYSAAGEWLEAARLIGSQADQALKKGRMALWLHWVELLPRTTLESQPALMVYRAWALFLSGRFATALIYVHSLLETIALESLPARVRGKWLSIQAWLANYSHTPDAVAIAARALQLIPPEDALSTVATLIPLANAQINAGALEEAIRNLAKAYHLGDTKLGYSVPTMIAAINYAFSLYDAGRNREAFALCQQLLSHYRDKDHRLLPLAELAYIPLGVLCYEANQLAEARNYALKAMVVSRNVLSQEVMGGDAERTVALAQFALGERDAALDTVRETLQLLSENGLSRITAMFARVEVELQLRLGELEPGKHWAHRMGFSPDTQPQPENITPLITYVRILIAQQQYQAAETLLSGLARIAADSRRHRELLVIHLLRVKLMTLQDNQKAAVNYFMQALQLTPPETKIRVFLDEGPYSQELLAAGRAMSPALIDRLANESRNAAALPKTAVPSPQTPVEPLSEREQEILSLIAAGHSNQEIANHLFITVGTTKWHLNNIYGKLGAGSRTQAIAYARQLNILP